MTKTELESKHLADLHQLAADAGVERYRMLTRAELIERLSDGDGGDSAPSAASAVATARRAATERRRAAGSAPVGARDPAAVANARSASTSRTKRRSSRRGGARAALRSRSAAPARRKDAERARRRARTPTTRTRARAPRRRRRRRRRFGRRREGISIQDLLLPAESGRQAVLLADSREAATDLLRGVAADLAGPPTAPTRSPC